MKKKVVFILGLHNHQPVGNFDHVFEEAYTKAYLPFLEILYEYPFIPFALHNSGVLWDWLLEKHPEYLELLGEMIVREQVEIMSGGYYEPILSVIPERDRQGQLTLMREFLSKRFDVIPRGCWLTERIWEPHLPKTLSDAGLDFVVVDDAHFKITGFSSEEMRGFFLTEEDGSYIRVFPIDKKLRYLIPFSEPEDTIEYLRGVASEESGTAKISVLADDGEKYGFWPGTHVLCYERNWLRRFCDSLMDNLDWLELSTFSRTIDEFPPVGIVYLPTAAYSEMMEWSLPLKAQERYSEAEEILKSSGRFEEPAQMVRGGFWRNFLVKYEESNWMHKRMLSVSELLENYRLKKSKDKVWKEARKHLYQAQCNCAYWHGLFGGLYLPHLRSAVYRHIVSAENLVEEEVRGGGGSLGYFREDLDGDGIEELVIPGRYLRAIFKLKGAVLRELDLRSPAFNLTDTLTRRKELYHKRLTALVPGSTVEAEKAVSIHNILASKENDLSQHLSYDFHIRASLVDHFIGEGVGLDAFSGSSYDELGDFLDGLYDLRVNESEDGVTFVFERKGRVFLDDAEVEAGVSKRIHLSDSCPELEVRYDITPGEKGLKCRFAVESVLSLLAGKAPDRYYRFPDRDVKESHLASAGEEGRVSSFSMVDEWLGIDIEFAFEPEAVLWRFPIETVSNSESGFEKVYQGSAVVPVWPLNLKKGKKAEIGFRLKVGPARK